jgi:fumarylpyruvate hydrolase
MGGDPNREVPFFFQKPADSVVESGQDVRYPTVTHDFQHEVELLLAIGTGGQNVSVESAQDRVYGIGVAIDLTRRDVQVEARKAGRPWEVGKSFDCSAACSGIVPIERGAVPAKGGSINLTVIGVVRQGGDLSQMVWSSAETLRIRIVRCPPLDPVCRGR